MDGQEWSKKGESQVLELETRSLGREPCLGMRRRVQKSTPRKIDDEAACIHCVAQRISFAFQISSVFPMNPAYARLLYPIQNLGAKLEK